MPKLSRYAQQIADTHDLESGSIKSFHSEKLGYTVYWKPDNYAVRIKYFKDLVEGDKTTAMLKCFFYRACDDKGKRMFLSKDDWDVVKNSTTMWSGIFEVAAEMLGGSSEEMFPDSDYGEKEATKN